MKKNNTNALNNLSLRERTPLSSRGLKGREISSLYCEISRGACPKRNREARNDKVYYAPRNDTCCVCIRKAQAILDYVLVLVIVIAALAIMGYYIRNSLSGKLRETADVFGAGEVYAPGTVVEK